jgi:glutamine amidotransferase
MELYQGQKGEQASRKAPRSAIHVFRTLILCKGDDEEAVSAVSEYGTTFDAAVEQDNLFGFQFHPEKSGTGGISILRRFAELAGGCR